MTFGIENNGFGNFVDKDGNVGSWIDTGNGKRDVFDHNGNYLGSSFDNDHGSTYYSIDGTFVADACAQSDGPTMIFGSTGSIGYEDNCMFLMEDDSPFEK